MGFSGGVLGSWVGGEGLGLGVGLEFGFCVRSNGEGFRVRDRVKV